MYYSSLVVIIMIFVFKRLSFHYYLLIMIELKVEGGRLEGNLRGQIVEILPPSRFYY